MDRERVVARVDRLLGYIQELRNTVPGTLEEYQSGVERRACERLLQLAIEASTDICGMLVAGLHLGLPEDEDDVYGRLQRAGVLQGETVQVLRRMRGFRNILVHENVDIDDAIVFEAASERLGDLDGFVGEVKRCLREHWPAN